MMEFCKIRDLEMSRVILGGNNFGDGLDATETASVVGAALDCGINAFDTSNNYGNTLSELYLGKALSRIRDKVIIATKFGGRELPTIPAVRSAAPYWVHRAIEDSLRRLGTDYVDLYYLHHPDHSVPIADTLMVLNDLVKAGKVRFIGCSNLSSAQLNEATDIAAMLGYSRFVCTQAEYSLLHRMPEDDGLIKSCLANDIAFVGYQPLASGLLTGKHKPGVVTGRLLKPNFRRFVTPRNYELVDQLREFASQAGRTLLDLSMGWVLAQSSVKAVVVGATTPDQVRANAAAGSCTLSAGELVALDRISRSGVDRHEV